MILATGLQSGGTTVVSGAFLKHPDLDGILDMASDRIDTNLRLVNSPVTWVKMTTISFTWREVAEIYQMQGYDIHPLMIVRNPYDVWASLKTKWYGINSVTAEDPPLVLRFRRFLSDWNWFRKQNKTIICFEEFILNPVQTLETACKSLPIEYIESLVNDRVKLDDIAYVSESNQSFMESLGTGVSSKIATHKKRLSESEYNWITESYKDVIKHYGYENNHQVYKDSSELGDEIIPKPFDSRRYVGFGSLAKENGVSIKIPELLSQCAEAVGAGIPVAIYGSGEFAHYLYSVLVDNHIKVKCFFDSFAPNNHRIFELPVLRFSTQFKNSFVIVASFKNAKDITTLLASEGVDSQSIFTFAQHS